MMGRTLMTDCKINDFCLIVKEPCGLAAVADCRRLRRCPHRSNTNAEKEEIVDLQ